MIKETLKAQLPKIKNLIYLSESGFFSSVNVELSDWEVSEGLETVILTLTLETYADEDFNTMSHIITNIEDKIHDVLNKVAFNENGNLVKPNGEDTVSFSGGMLLHELHFSTMEDNSLEISVDCMFIRLF